MEKVEEEMEEGKEGREKERVVKGMVAKVYV